MVARKKPRLRAVPARDPVKVDFGCGPNKKDGFLGVDQHRMTGVDIVGDVTDPLFWGKIPGPIEEAHASHFVEHLDARGRIAFFNGLWRGMKPGAQFTMIVPHWASCRAYGDPTHAWPPIGEFFFYYLDREWRAANAPHTDRQHWPAGYDCDFGATWGYAINPALSGRNAEFQQFAINNYKEAAQDIHATLTRKG